MPLDSLVHWYSKKVKRDGKRIRRLIKELINIGYLLSHKGGNTISLNPAFKEEIIEYIEKNISEKV